MSANWRAPQAELEQIIDRWVQRAEDEPDLVYANPRHPGQGAAWRRRPGR